MIEKSLAVDNIFVFLMIFNFFAVPCEFQKRALILGVVGAISLRVMMILLGAWLIAHFHWLLYIFGAFLLFTGIKMIIFADHKPDLNKNVLLKWLRNHLNITHEYHGEKFIVYKDRIRFFTPLFLVLIAIAVTDVIFAVDSIPAIFAITEDPFIVMTSNIFAILGLRAMYFMLAEVSDRFHLLSYGLAIILIFVGTKMLIVEWFKVPVGWSLLTIVTILIATMLLSLWTSKAERKT